MPAAWLVSSRPAALPLPASTAPARPYFVTVGTIRGSEESPHDPGRRADLVARLGQRAPELVIIGSAAGRPRKPSKC